MDLYNPLLRRLIISVLGLPIFLLVSCSYTDSSMATISQPSIEKDSSSLSAYNLFNKAITLRSEGNLDKAKRNLLEVIVLDDKRIDAYTLLGDIYFGENDFEQAEVMYLASIELNAENPVLFGNLGVIFDINGEQEKAISSYLESIRLSPNDAQIHYNLGLAYSRNIEFLDDAIMRFLRALELDPSLGNVHYDLGRIYEYLDQTILAIEHYRNSVELGYALAEQSLRQLE